MKVRYKVLKVFIHEDKSIRYYPKVKYWFWNFIYKTIFDRWRVKWDRPEKFYCDSKDRAWEVIREYHVERRKEKTGYLVYAKVKK